MEWGETVLIWSLGCCRFGFSGTENLSSVRALLLRVRSWKPLSLSSFLILSFAHVCGWSILGFAGWIYLYAVRHESTFLAWMKIWEMHRVRCLLLLFGPFLDTCFSLQTRGFVFSSPGFWSLLELERLLFSYISRRNDPWAPEFQAAAIFCDNQLSNGCAFVWELCNCFRHFVCVWLLQSPERWSSWVNMGSQGKRLLGHHGMSLSGLQTTSS